MDKEELKHNTISELRNYEVVKNDEIMQIKMFNNLPPEIITYVDKDDNVVLLDTTTSMKSNSDFVFFDSNQNEIPHSIYTLEAAIPDGKVVLKLAIVIFDSKGLLRQLFNEQMDLISYQIKQLREKYHKLKDNDFNEQKHLFKDRYNIDFISDENFFSFLSKKIPSLHLNLNGTLNKKFNIARLNELSFTWLKSDITIGIFHEYCNMIISQFESSLKIVATKKQTDKDFNAQNKKELEQPSPVTTLLEPKISKSETKEKIPVTKVMMTFIEAIEEHTREIFIPKEFNNNDDKYRILANNIKEKFKYEYKAGTLENNRHGINTDNNDEIEKVIKLLKDWNYNDVATKYSNGLKRY